ncbi:MAG: histidinol dehydrogenase, partial [Mucilaginibacter sp.]
MKTYNYSELNKEQIGKLVQRNVDPANEIRVIVEEIIGQVQQKGDNALLDYALKFDKVELDKLYLDKGELTEIASAVTAGQKAALEIAYNNIYKFHAAQLNTDDKVETMPGVTCWRELRPVEKVGLYIPGGSAVLPSTFLMLCIPAKIAGCHEIIVCSPPQKNGKVNAFIAYIALLLGIDKIYLAG